MFHITPQKYELIQIELIKSSIISKNEFWVWRGTDHESVVLDPGLHGARFSNSTKIDMLKFRKNSEKNS
jgi:hypothetical protein